MERRGVRQRSGLAAGVVVDRCTSKTCGEVYFDAGELEILLKAKSSLLSRIFGK